MKISLKGKGLFKTIALALAGVAAITAVGFGVKAIVDYTKNDLKTISPSFEVGNLGADGKFVEDESTLYTKEAFGCYGLQVKPDFDSTVNYQIFYYDILDNYISSTSFMSDGYSGEAPVNGAYARMVIEPTNDEDGKISLIEKVKYPSQITVKVKKNQDINERFFVLSGHILDVKYDLKDLIFVKGFYLDEEGNLISGGNEVYRNQNCCTISSILKISGGEKLTFDFSSFDGHVNGFSVTQYSELKESALVESQTHSDSLVLDKKTKYIVLSVYTDNNAGWSDSELSVLPSKFNISKTK